MSAGGGRWRARRGGGDARVRAGAGRARARARVLVVGGRQVKMHAP